MSIQLRIQDEEHAPADDDGKLWIVFLLSLTQSLESASYLTQLLRQNIIKLTLIMNISSDQHH